MFSGVLKKMVSIHDNPVRYIMDFDDDLVFLNQIIGKKIKIHKTGYCCLSCYENLQIFANGFCKKCFFESPMSGDWVMKPELSKAHLGIQERDIEYEKKVQLQPHILYLAFTSDIKIGVTRKSQTPTRWIDQGAIKAIEILEVPNRYLAGISEVKLKEYYKDKTNWREMLKNNKTDIDLENERLECLKNLPNEVLKYISKEKKEIEIKYPISKSPLKPSSLNIVKTEKYSGKIIGIKGQYLIFEDDTVFNIRSNEGVVVNISLD